MSAPVRFDFHAEAPMEHRLTVYVDGTLDGLTVKQLLSGRLDLSSRLIKKLKYSGGILVDGEISRVRRVLREGETVELLTDRADEGSQTVEPCGGELDILFEDDDLIALNKPAGLAVHPSPGNRTGTLGNIVAGYYADRGGSFVLRPVNRLDRNTSGIVLIAKNTRAASIMGEQMSKRRIEKRYSAIVHGMPDPPDGVVDAPIRRADASVITRVVSPDGKRAVTRYHTVRALGELTLLDVFTETGRTHQIRVHMAHIGCPLAGDFLYGREEPWLIGRHALHMGYIAFAHPTGGERIELSCPLADDMSRLLERLSAPSGAAADD